MSSRSTRISTQPSMLLLINLTGRFRSQTEATRSSSPRSETGLLHSGLTIPDSAIRPKLRRNHFYSSGWGQGRPKPFILVQRIFMSQISQLLPPENIVLDLEIWVGRNAFFVNAGLIFENEQGVRRSIVFDSLFAREKLGSTGLGRGIAIPHGRSRDSKKEWAFIRLTTSVPFDSPDGEPVSMLCPARPRASQ